MLRFTEQQQNFVLWNRRTFNERQARMGAGNEDAMLGNALPMPRDMWGEWDRAVDKNRRVVQILNGMPMTTRAQFRANMVLIHHAGHDDHHS